MEVTNALAYYDTAKVTAVKIFIVKAPVVIGSVVNAFGKVKVLMFSDTVGTRKLCGGRHDI
jgi:hypothetical protein